MAVFKGVVIAGYRKAERRNSDVSLLARNTWKACIYFSLFDLSLYHWPRLCRRNGPRVDTLLFSSSLAHPHFPEHHLCGSRHLATPARALIPLITLPGSMHTCTRAHSCAPKPAYAFTPRQKCRCPRTRASKA